jgi:PleD family two-component response regulator
LLLNKKDVEFSLGELMPTEPTYVLLIEDDIDIAEAIESVFHLENIRYQSMKDGQSALDYLNSVDQNPSLIIMDVMMPLLNGFEFRKKQLSNKKIANIPTIAMSATSDFEKVDAGHFNEFIKKPIDIEQFIDLIKKYLRS